MRARAGILLTFSGGFAHRTACEVLILWDLPHFLAASSGETGPAEWGDESCVALPRPLIAHSLRQGRAGANNHAVLPRAGHGSVQQGPL